MRKFVAVAAVLLSVSALAVAQQQIRRKRRLRQAGSDHRHRPDRAHQDLAVVAEHVCAGHGAQHAPGFNDRLLAFWDSCGS